MEARFLDKESTKPTKSLHTKTLELNSLVGPADDDDWQVPLHHEDIGRVAETLQGPRIAVSGHLRPSQEQDGV